MPRGQQYWLQVRVHVPTRERLDECLAFERELTKKGITFDTGIAVHAGGKLAEWRDWQLDWSFHAPPRMTRTKVLEMLKKRGFNFEAEREVDK